LKLRGREVFDGIARDHRGSLEMESSVRLESLVSAQSNRKTAADRDHGEINVPDMIDSLGSDNS
jgi:hypothetical protein